MMRFAVTSVLGGMLLLAWHGTGPGQEPAPTPPDEFAGAAAEGRARLVRDPGGHAARPIECVFTRDGKKLISAGQDRTVQVWDVTTRERLFVLRPPLGADGRGGLPRHLVVDAAGKQLAFWVECQDDSGTAQRVTFVCSLADGSARGYPGGGAHAVFAPDGTAITIGDGPSVTLLDLGTGKPRHTARIARPGTKNIVVDLALSPDDSRLAVVVGDGLVYLLDPATLKVKRRLKATVSNVRNVGWADDRTVVCRTSDGTKALIVLDTETGALKHSYPASTLLAQLPKGQANTANFKNCHAITGSTKVFVLTRNSISGGPRNGWRTDVSFLLDWQTGAIGKPFVAVSLYGATIAIAPDRSIAAQGDGGLNDIILFNPADGQALAGGRLRAAVRGVDGLYNSIRWRPDGKAIAWRKLSDGADRGFAELDLTTLTLAKKREGDLKGYGRHITRRAGPMKLEYKFNVRHNVDITGGPRPLQFPVEPNGPIETDLTFCGEGRVVATSWNSPNIQVFDPATGKRVANTPVARSYIQSIAVSPDQRDVLVGTADQTLSIYHPASDKVLLTIFPTGADWIAWTPAGYYAATPGGERRMGWLVDNGLTRLATFLPAERFRARLYRPEVIKRVLDKGSVDEAVKAANAASKVQTRSAALDELLPPRVTLQIVDQSALPRVKVRATATASSKGQPIKGMRLLLDGLRIADQPSSVEFADGKPQASVEWEITLPDGRADGAYKLAVLARGGDAAALSEPVPVTFVNKGRLPTLHVLAIGINQYRDQQLTLSAAKQDATTLCDAFSNQAGKSGMFGAVNTKLLLDNQADAKAVCAALVAMRKDVKPNDLFVVFFAGHGLKGANGLYLLTAEADTSNEANLAKTTISSSYLRETLGEFPCKVLLMLDACHANAFGAGGTKGAMAAKGYRPATDDLTRSLTSNDVGVAVLCAAMASERAQERSGQGLFTGAVVKALKGAKGVPFNRQNRLLYIHHLFSFVFDEVSSLSEDEQHPFLHLPWSVQSFPVSKLGKQ